MHVIKECATISNEILEHSIDLLIPIFGKVGNICILYMNREATRVFTTFVLPCIVKFLDCYKDSIDWTFTHICKKLPNWEIFLFGYLKFFDNFWTRLLSLPILLITLFSKLTFKLVLNRIPQRCLWQPARSLYQILKIHQYHWQIVLCLLFHLEFIFLLYFSFFYIFFFLYSWIRFLHRVKINIWTWVCLDALHEWFWTNLMSDNYLQHKTRNSCTKLQLFFDTQNWWELLLTQNQTKVSPKPAKGNSSRSPHLMVWYHFIVS